jgi:hypothetical protein
MFVQPALDSNNSSDEKAKSVLHGVLERQIKDENQTYVGYS